MTIASSLRDFPSPEEAQPRIPTSKRKRRMKTKRCLLAILLLAISGCDKRSSTPATAGAGTTDRDNTAVNARDRDSAAKTPFDQKENKADITTTADVRKRIVASDMSTDAKNVKIITENGRVTLRGPV